MNLPRLEALKSSNPLKPEFYLIKFNGTVATFTNGFTLVRWKYVDEIQSTEHTEGKYLHINHWAQLRRLNKKTVLVASPEGVWANVYGSGMVLFKWASAPARYAEIGPVLEQLKNDDEKPFIFTNTSRFQKALSIFEWGDLIIKPVGGHMILITKEGFDKLIVATMRSPNEMEAQGITFDSLIFQE